MEDRFYRREKKESLLKNLSKSIIANKKLMVLLAIAIPLILFVLFNPKGIVKRMSMEDQKRQMEKSIDSLKAEQIDLQQKSKALENNKKVIEKTARERYGMVKEGETVYRVQRKQQ